MSVLLGACADGATNEPTPPADPLLDVVEREGSVVVVVQLLVPRGTASSWSSTDVGGAQRKLMRELGPGARVVERFGRKLPQIVLRVDAAALQELRRSELVVNISLAEE